MSMPGGVKRVLMLTARHSAFDGRVFHLEAKALHEAGFEVTIAAPRLKDEPSEAEGIRIKTFTKARGGINRKISTLRSLIRAAMENPADVFHVHELDALIPAAIARRRLAKRGRRVVLLFDSHEVWPYFYAGKTRSRLLRELVKHLVIAFEDWMLSGPVDAVITAHEIEENYYLWLNPWMPVRKVLGGPPLEKWGEPPRRSGPVEVLGHDGYFTLSRGMKTILAAFEMIAPEYPAVHLLAAGDFQFTEDREYFDSWCSRTGLGERVTVEGWVDRTDIVAYLDRMDVGIVANHPDIHSIRCWPANKMMYYLGRALPVVSTPTPLYRRFIERERCGLAMDSFKPSAMAKAFRFLIENPDEAREMGKRGYTAARSSFGWEQAQSELLKMYEELETLAGPVALGTGGK